MSEKKDVNLTLTFERDSEEGKETENFTVLGTLEIEETKVRIHYNRNENEVKEDVTLIIHKDLRVEIMRKGGGYESQMFLRQEKEVNANYLTPYGAMNISTIGKFVNFLFDGSNGVLKLTYELLFNHEYYSTNNVTVKIEEK